MNMNKPDTPTLDKALTEWSVEQDVTDFIKARLGLKDKGSKTTHAEDIIDNAIDKAKVEEKPEWTNLLLNQIKPDKKEGGGGQTIFNIAANVADETLKKLIDVTPVKKKNKIEELI